MDYDVKKLLTAMQEANAKASNYSADDYTASTQYTAGRSRSRNGGTSTGFISDALHHARQHKTCKGLKLLEVTDDE